MKMRSIVGPLVLIALGTIFLFNNIYPDLNLFTLFAKYWPFLLIGLGVLRLLEVLAYAARSKPLPSQGLSGGEIFLIVLICIAGTLFYEARRHAGPFRISRRTMEFLGESFDYPVSQQKAIGEKSRILFDNVRGNVRVSGADAPEIRISGRKTIRAYNKADADKANEQCPLEVIVQGDRVIVRTNQEKVSEDRRVTSDLEVSVPRGASIEGRGRLGDFDITGIAGGVELASDNAGVRLNKIGGNAKVDVKRSDIVRAVDIKGMVEVLGRGGDLELENIDGPVSVNGAFAGNLEFKNLAKPIHFSSRNTDFRVERLPGRISMDLAALSGVNLVGPITLTTKSKDVKIEEFTQSLQVDLERGDIELRPHDVPLAKIDARCRNGGNIELALPPQGKFELVASTDKGEVRNDYGSMVKVDTEGRSATMKASMGGPSIQVSTARGTVTVRKE
jgi:Putative adhesin